MDPDSAQTRLASGMAVPIGAEYRRGIHDMLLLAVRGSVPRGVCWDPHLHYKCASPRFRAELPIQWIAVTKVVKILDANLHVGLQWNETCPNRVKGSFPLVRNEIDCTQSVAFR